MPHIELIIQHPSSGVSMPEAPRGKLYQAPPPRALIFGVGFGTSLCWCLASAGQ